MSRVSAWVALVLGMGAAGCGGDPAYRPPPCVPASGTPHPIAHVGPDITVEMPCGGQATRPIASISAVEGGPFTWTARITPRDIFAVDPRSVRTCAGDPVSILSVIMAAPLSALAGESFEGLLTVAMLDTGAPLGTAMVRETVVAPKATVAPTLIDFGDLSPGLARYETIELATDDPTVTLTAQAPRRILGIFSMESSGVYFARGKEARLSVQAVGTTPGAYVEDLVFGVQAESPSRDPLPCASKLVVKLRARIVESPDGGTDS